MYCCEFENTKDGSLNFSPDNILNRQLIFTRDLTPYQKENYHWIEYDLEEDLSEENITKRWKVASDAKDVVWEEIKDEKGHTWNAWVIKK